MQTLATSNVRFRFQTYTRTGNRYNLPVTADETLEVAPVAPATEPTYVTLDYTGEFRDATHALEAPYGSSKGSNQGDEQSEGKYRLYYAPDATLDAKMVAGAKLRIVARRNERTGVWAAVESGEESYYSVLYKSDAQNRGYMKVARLAALVQTKPSGS